MTDHILVSIKGPLTKDRLLQHEEMLGMKLAQCLAEKRDLILNLRQCPWVHSLIIGLWMKASQVLESNGLTFEVIKPSQDVRNILNVLHFHKIIREQI